MSLQSEEFPALGGGGGGGQWATAGKKGGPKGVGNNPKQSGGGGGGRGRGRGRGTTMKL